MIASWMLYLVAVSAVLVLVALSLEMALSAAGRPTRWVWMTAIAGSTLWPVFVLAGRRFFPEPIESATAVGDVGVTLGEPIITGATGQSMTSMDEPLLIAWVVLSVALAIACLVSYARLARSRREWPQARIGEKPVLLSEDVGPAVVGFFRTAIVLPRWALDVETSLRDLMIAHEEEHIGSKDTLLVLSGLAALVIAPWNLPLWWQVRRLRGAIEIDCDARVLRRHGDVRVYGNLLLEVGRRCRDSRFAMAAFSERSSSLERRIKLMSRNRPRALRLRLLGSSAFAVLLFAFACELPEPVGTVQNAPPPEPTTDATATWQYSPTLSDEPVFTPYNTQPEIQNSDEIRSMMVESYPADLRDAGIGGTTNLWVFIDETGQVGTIKVAEASGYSELDEAAQKIMSSAEFSPAELEGEPVPVWVQLPITFDAIAAAEPASLERRPSRMDVESPPPPAPDAKLSDGPVFTPYEVTPEILNRDEYTSYLSQGYPAELREAGVGGTVAIWVFIDEAGKVAETRVARSSGRPELDGAALYAIQQATFSPAENRGKAVAVWVQFPVTFQARGN